MGLDQLWAAWRNDYVVGATAQEREPSEHACVFCSLADLDPLATNGVLVRQSTTFAVLNAYPYGSGHSLILPRRHVAKLGELTDEERRELFGLLSDLTEAIELAYVPDGINIGATLGRAAGAGIPAHLHLHALPRWSGDTNFMTTVGATRVLPEELNQTYQRLNDGWLSS